MAELGDDTSRLLTLNRNMKHMSVAGSYSIVLGAFMFFITFGVLTAATATVVFHNPQLPHWHFSLGTSAAKLRKFHRLASNSGRQGHSPCACNAFLGYRICFEPVNKLL